MTGDVLRPKVKARHMVFKTPWFQVIAKRIKGSDRKPYYALKMADYVTVIAVTRDEHLVLVRQYRPAVESMTLEWPSGCVEKSETPLSTACRELAEETGYTARRFHRLGRLLPDTGRLSNSLWGYLAFDARLSRPAPRTEAGIQTILVKPEVFLGHLRKSTFGHALNVAVFQMALLKHAAFRRLFTKHIL